MLGEALSATRITFLHCDDIVIAQNMVRQLQACKKVTSMRNERAALNIQRSFRGFKGRSNASDLRAYLENERRCQKAATDIQRTWRGYDQKQQYWFTVDQAVQIQSVARGMIVRDQLGREHAAATDIQSAWRGKSAVTAYQQYRAARIIQAAWRGKFAHIAYMMYLGGNTCSNVDSKCLARLCRPHGLHPYNE